MLQNSVISTLMFATEISLKLLHEMEALFVCRYVLIVPLKTPAGRVSHMACSCASTALASTAPWVCISASSGRLQLHNSNHSCQS